MRIRTWWLLVAIALGLLAAVNVAQADIVTEFGAGVKLSTTSYVLRPECHTVRGHQPPSQRNTASCGGDNPVFVGWPVAWQSDRPGAFQYRVGWFHMSHWFDGGDSKETHMDCLCASITFNWSKRKK